MILKQLFNCKDELDKRINLNIRNQYYQLVFAKYGKNVRFAKPLMVVNPNHIYIGDNVTIRSGMRLEPVINWKGRKYNPLIKIGNNVIIEQNCHMVCANSMVIENNVLISSNVFITDLDHVYTKINEPVMKQKIIVKNTTIKESSFLGTGVKIMAGVTIGKHCIVGANSVVTKSVPDYCVLAGVPARIIKQYNQELQEWVKC